MTNNFQALAAEMLPALEVEMRAVLGATNTTPDLFHGMMHYHMGWVDADLQPASINGGKQIRPLLLLLTTAAAGGDWHQALPAAAAIEILHNFSLVHDDIEDASPTRRGRDTLWKIWGIEQAINTGDAMFALAHLALVRLADCGVPADTVVYALRRFDETCVALTQGQHADMDFEQRDGVTPDEYMAMITGKTAVLIALCAELGAKIGGSDSDTITHYASFARELGLAFQVIDDILGIWGDETRTGKSAATDIITKKKTLPVLYGLTQNADLRQLYQQETADATFVTKAITLLNDIGAHTYANQLAETHSQNALNHLHATNAQGQAGQALQELADMLLNRDF